MVKKCLHCKKEISEDAVLDVCKACGHKIWGEKMFSTIEQNMKNARDAGDLYQGSVTGDLSALKRLKAA